MNPQKGFAPIVIIIAVVMLLVVGAGGYFIVSKLKPAPITSPAPQEPQPSSPEKDKSQTAPPPQTPTASPVISTDLRLLNGLWKIEKGFSFDGGQWKEEAVPGGAHAYLEFKSDGRICGEWTILPKLSCRKYNIYTVSGDKERLDS